MIHVTRMLNVDQINNVFSTNVGSQVQDALVIVSVDQERNVLLQGNVEIRRHQLTHRLLVTVSQMVVLRDCVVTVRMAGVELDLQVVVKIVIVNVELPMQVNGRYVVLAILL
jgi:hypothetical protein